MDQAQPFLPIFAPPDPLPERPARLGRTEVTYADARDILTRAGGFIGSYDYTLNPYSGCSYGCSYCYAAEGFSPSAEKKAGWGRWVSIKQNAAALIEKRPDGSLDGAAIYMSSVTDPYQPIDRKVKLTRSVLKAIADAHSPRLVVQTRGTHMTRDIDLFEEIERRGGRVQVNVTVTTDDEDTRRAFEPGCASGTARLAAAAALCDAGVQTAITLTPLLLVTDPDAFANSLLNTGVRRFIIQGFNTNEHAQFTASTRELALNTLAERLDVSESEVLTAYAHHYRKARSILAARLPNLGEGREGFRPPF